MSGSYLIRKESLTILSWNCGGLSSEKVIDLLERTKQYKPDIICVQENMNAMIPIEGYNAFTAHSYT